MASRPHAVIYRKCCALVLFLYISFVGFVAMVNYVETSADAGWGLYFSNKKLSIINRHISVGHLLDNH